jgi:class 3 adenylate cyclase/tetratricopeptide (TPR) repeat protein
MVSVLFADLVGFTALAEERDAEAVRELLSRYFEIAREIVDRYGGQVEKFIGDAVMALWGAPTAHEDDAERAVRAALELVDSVPRLEMPGGAALQVRAGVLTGEAAVSLGATGQGLVAGDLVNTASRLQSVAPSGTVLVGEATRQAAGAAIAFEAQGEAQLKGKTLPVPAYRALRVVAERGGVGRADALEPPFVGRGDELRLLKEQFHATGRERRARLISLVGQAGIGKSRLAWELEKYLDGVVETVWWHRGRSPSYGEGITFWALGEMVRRRALLAEGADEPSTRSAVARMLEQHVPDPEERRWIEPRLLVLLGVEDAPPGGREELFAAWRTFFERVAAQGTVALVFEDLQWSDDGLLDFLEHLLDWSRALPIFVVTLARPEILERRPGWGTDRPGAIAMRLEPLAEPAMQELLAALVPAMPPGAVERILARADGIPLYAVETIRMLIADGRLVHADGAYRPTGDLGELAVPATLHALVAARLDALSPDDRTLLQYAAVLGQSFSHAALAAVSGETPEALGPRLASLVRRELIAVETDPRAPTRGQHAFVQALVREIAYGMLSRRERRSRHLAAARYFESLGDDELAGALATHYLAAHRAAPEGPEGEAAAAQARIALRAAADRAESLGALGQAADFLRSAVEVSPTGGRAAILTRLGFVDGVAGRYESGRAALRQAVEAADAAGDAPGALLAHGYIVSSLLSEARIAEALDEVGRVRPLADRLEGIPAAAGALAEFAEASARAFFRTERNDEAVAWADRAIELAEPLRRDEVVAMALVTKGSAMVGMGRQREGIAILIGGQADARAHGLPIAALRAGVNLAAMLLDQDPRASLQRSREGMAEAKRLGLQGFDPYHAGNASSAAARLGEWAAIQAELAQLAEANPDPSTAAWIRDCIDQTRAWQGTSRPGRSEELLHEGESVGDPQTILNARETLVRELFTAERFAAAVEVGLPMLEHAFVTPGLAMQVGRAGLHARDTAVASRVVAHLEPGPGGACDADLAVLRAGIAALEARPEDALVEYRSALAGYRDFGMRFDTAMVGLDMAALLDPSAPAVRAVATEARGTLVELGALPLVARLDRLLGSGGDRLVATGLAVGPSEARSPEPT